MQARHQCRNPANIIGARGPDVNLGVAHHSSPSGARDHDNPARPPWGLNVRRLSVSHGACPF